MRIKDTHKIKMRTFQCERCGVLTTAPKVKHKTPLGHIKTMWCYQCREVTDHCQVEIRAV